LSSTAVLVATLTERPSEEEPARLSGRVGLLELRAALAGGVVPAWLRSRFGGWIGDTNA